MEELGICSYRCLYTEQLSNALAKEKEENIKRFYLFIYFFVMMKLYKVIQPI